MQQLVDVWNAMDLRRRAILFGGLAGLVTILLVLSRLAATPSYALLYSGLDPAAAGEVISALEARGIRYQVRGESIHVEETGRDALRMSLAGEGLPTLGSAGYELLDSLSGFGTTSQMFDAAYWRAKEGELARTITSSPAIRAARVHLATPGNDPFSPNSEPSASVSVRPAGSGISTGQAQALRFLVASAVPNLSPENVTIVDSQSGRILANNDAQGPSADAATLSDELRQNVERLLFARVGPGNAVVEISIELNTARETVVERIIDPASRVIIGTESEENTNNSREAGQAAVTVASNLPDGDAAAGEGGGSTLQSSETRERVTYDISETQREIENGPGRISRISVAVLVNSVPVVGEDGVLREQPRDAAELESLQSLVESAIGFDAQRGDVVTLQSMVFEPVPVADDLVASGGLFSGLDLMSILQLASLVGLALALGFGVIRPALQQQAASLPVGANASPGGATAMLPLQQTPAAASLPPPDEVGHQPSVTPAAPALVPPTGIPDPPALPVPQNGTELPAPEQDPVSRLRRLIEEREEETIEVLRAWMEEDEEAT